MTLCYMRGTTRSDEPTENRQQLCSSPKLKGDF